MKTMYVRDGSVLTYGEGVGTQWFCLQSGMEAYFAGQPVTVERTPTGIECYPTPQVPEKPYALSDLISKPSLKTDAIALTLAVIVAVLLLIYTLPF